MRQPPAETKVKQTLFVLYKWGLTRPRADTRQWSSDDDVQRGDVITICFNVTIQHLTGHVFASICGWTEKEGRWEQKQTNWDESPSWLEGPAEMGNNTVKDTPPLWDVIGFFLLDAFLGSASLKMYLYSY